MKRTVLEDGRTVKFEAEEGRFLTTEALKHFGLIMVVPIENEHKIIEVSHDKKKIIKEEVVSEPKAENNSELDDMLEMIRALEQRINDLKNES